MRTSRPALRNCRCTNIAVNRAVSSHGGRVGLARAGAPDSATIETGPVVQQRHGSGVHPGESAGG